MGVWAEGGLKSQESEKKTLNYNYYNPPLLYCGQITLSNIDEICP